ncbi:MAG TPA: helix-turn-helix transcriptional regulator [Bacilli bacterium]|nr:helix-turn-helix transcriptional regulator [Bacilli bacterium]HQA19360.1 helix-turn-helix transcriptional regulator [Bacilli bacterium]HQD92717.1 helix-turn-helix transcriptional regulator [Bacilli bacterium]
MQSRYPVVDLKATGKRIKHLREQHNMSVRDLQIQLGFESPQAIYKWQWGESLPSIDNLIILAHIFNCTINDIIVTTIY